MRRTRHSRGVALAIAGLLALAAGGCAAPAAVQTADPTADTATRTPTPTPTPPTALELAEQRVEDLSVRERAALVVMGTVPGTDTAGLSAYVSGGPRGVILMGGNVPPSPEALRGLTDRIHTDSADALIAIDQEGGDVKRMPWDDLPSARTLKSEDAASTRAAFTERGALLDAAGVDINFGVVADVPRTDGSFIFRRSFGTDPQAVAEHVAAAVAGERGQVATTLKHFPGHGAAEGDSHHAIPTTDQTLADWRAADAVPFQAGIDAGAELVMTGHLRFTAVSDRPASLSPEWYRILRDEMGFTGVAVTDDLGMLTASGEAEYADIANDAVLAVEAGADLVLVIAGTTPETATQVIDALTARAQGDAAFEERLSEAAARVTVLAESTRS